MAMPTGVLVEEYVLHLMEDLFYDHFAPSTEAQDKLQGTDCFLFDIPVDVTLNENKNFTRHLHDIVLEGITIRVGIRYRNPHQKFGRHVLVLLFETYDVRSPEAIYDLIEDNVDMETIQHALTFYPKHR